MASGAEIGLTFTGFRIIFTRSMDQLVVVGARQHNLANLSCEIPRNRLVVITGPSGSGKSSLAFDTIYAEGQRRYVESLSIHARQFLRQLPKPDVDSIEGLSPAIAIEQGRLGRNPRSTVGTVTELSDYLRLLFARVGTAHCPVTGKPLRAHSVEEMVDTLLARPEGARVSILGPLARGERSDLAEPLERLRDRGFVRVRLDGKVLDLDAIPSIDARTPHDLEVLVDRVVLRRDSRSRLGDSIEIALAWGGGTVLLDVQATAEAPVETLVMSDRLVSWEAGVTLPALEPRLFSFNSPQGACPACEGLGVTSAVDPEAVVGAPTRSLREGAVPALGARGSVARAVALERIVRALQVDPDVPWERLPQGQREQILFGASNPKRKTPASPERKPQTPSTPRFSGVIAYLEQLAQGNTPQDDLGADEEGALSADDALTYQCLQLCPACGGQRLRPEALSVSVAGTGFGTLADLELHQLHAWLESLPERSELEPRQRAIARPIVRALLDRLRFLIQVGLGSLVSNRATSTLSGGEAQRIRLATQLGASLSGVLYVLDEPSIGLHPRDNDKLLEALRALVDKGNSVLVVEHDRDAIFAADHVIDMGPGAGTLGGRIVASGTPAEIRDDPTSISGPYLRGPRIEPCRRHAPSDRMIEVRGARANNLKNVDVHIPVGLFTAVTGVSGSGKSSLVVDVLLAEARARINGSVRVSSSCEGIAGLEHFDRVISVDQAPIGRSPRSTPASFTGIFAQLRDLYAGLPEARARGFKPGRFSFNVKGGRCEKCHGDGVLRVEMHFLPDVYVPCDACDGRRYNRDTLELEYRGLSIADALDTTVDRASEVFAQVPKIAQRLDGLRHIGLGYLTLGQPATTLSGGEAQRLKLSSELWKRGSGKTLYILDEPTTGLHFSDIEMLLSALRELRDAGNTVLVIEHHMDVVAQADWVLDLGPEGGRDGGELVAQGPPERIARHPQSRTAPHLAKLLFP